MNFCDWVVPGLGCVGGFRRLGVVDPAMNLVWLVLAKGLSGFCLAIVIGLFGFSLICRPGGDLLFRVLRRSTIGAEEFNGRVRDGIGFGLLAIATRPANQRFVWSFARCY